MKTSMKLLSIALVGLSLSFSDLAAQRRRGLVDVSHNHERHGFWLSGGLGAGWENYRFDVPGEWQTKDQAAPSFWLSLGGTVSPHLRLGGEFNAWVHEHQDLESGFNVTESLVGALLVGQVYPARNLGLFLKGGFGISRSGSDISGPDNSIGETGFAYLGGLGYEIRLARNIFLSPVASVMYHTSGDRNAPEGNLRERVVTLGVTFTFQPGR